MKNGKHCFKFHVYFDHRSSWEFLQFWWCHWLTNAIVELSLLTVPISNQFACTWMLENIISNPNLYITGNPLSNIKVGIGEHALKYIASSTKALVVFMATTGVCFEYFMLDVILLDDYSQYFQQSLKLFHWLLASNIMYICKTMNIEKAKFWKCVVNNLILYCYVCDRINGFPCTILLFVFGKELSNCQWYYSILLHWCFAGFRPEPHQHCN